MNRPIKLQFRSRALSELSSTDSSATSASEYGYTVRATLKHTVGEVKHLIWVRAKVEPKFVHIFRNGVELANEEKLWSILDLNQVEENQEFVFDLEIDEGWNSKDAMEDMFDISIKWDGHTLNLREPLSCTLESIKDYIKERGFDDEIILKRFDKEYSDNEMTLSDVLNLDVAPLYPVELEVVNNTTRFLVKLESSIERLQSSLIEVNKTTTIMDFKRKIIQKVDEDSVARTFPDQIKMYYESHLIGDTNEGYLYDVLALNREMLSQSNIVIIQLEVTENVSGTGGVLSRDFWRDLRAPNRFEFLPNDNPTPEPPQARRFEPLKILLDNGDQWGLRGESYERVVSNNNTSNDMLVSQDDLGDKFYEVTLDTGNGPQTALLNTAQCIIVDDGSHQPYVLLSSSGASKLHNTFKDQEGNTLMQQVQVLLHENNVTPMHVSVPRIPSRAVVDTSVRIGRSLMEGLRRFVVNYGVTIFKYALTFYMLGIHALVADYWMEALFVTSVGLILYVFFYAGDRISDLIEANLLQERDPRQAIGPPGQIVHGLVTCLRTTKQISSTIARNTFIYAKDHLVNFVVIRTRDYVYLVEQQNWLFWLIDNINLTIKDALMLFLTVFPSLHTEILDQMAVWKDSELQELQAEVEMREQELELKPELGSMNPEYEAIKTQLTQVQGDDEKKYRLYIKLYKMVK